MSSDFHTDTVGTCVHMLHTQYTLQKKKKKIEKRAHLKLCLSYYENSQGNKRRKIIKGSYKHGIRRVF